MKEGGRFHEIAHMIQEFQTPAILMILINCHRNIQDCKRFLKSFYKETLTS